jgi:NAD(P)-dependent dehydrogenase (short-subunit alcohol dehydrogenase family)
MIGHGWSLEGQTAIVTGGGSGIGAATALVLDHAGAIVVTADAELGSAERTAALGSRMYPTQIDVRDEDSVTRAIATAYKLEDRLDVLVNVAGIASASAAPSMSLAHWENVFAVNARGTFLCCKHVLPYMIEQGNGVIVNIASVAGLVGLRNRAAYCASKGAVIGLTRALSADHARDGVRVNCVCPGTIDTPWVQRLVEERGESLDELRGRQPIGRLGTPEEVAQAVLYLASPAGGFCAGSLLVIDGGITAV